MLKIVSDVNKNSSEKSFEKLPIDCYNAPIDVKSTLLALLLRIRAVSQTLLEPVLKRTGFQFQSIGVLPLYELNIAMKAGVRVQDLVSVRGNVHKSFGVDFGVPIRCAISSTTVDPPSSGAPSSLRHYIQFGGARLPVYSGMQLWPILGGIVGQNSADTATGAGGPSDTNAPANVIRLSFQKRRAIGSPVEHMEVSLRLSSRESFLVWHQHISEVLADTKANKAFELGKSGVLSTTKLRATLQDIALLVPNNHFVLRRLKAVTEVRGLMDGVIERMQLRPCPVSVDEVASIVMMGANPIVTPIVLDKQYVLLGRIVDAGQSISSSEMEGIFTELEASSAASDTIATAAMVSDAAVEPQPAIAQPPKSGQASSPTPAPVSPSSSLPVVPASAIASTSQVRTPRKRSKAALHLSRGFAALVIVAAVFFGMWVSSFFRAQQEGAGALHSGELDLLLDKVNQRISADLATVKTPSSAVMGGLLKSKSTGKRAGKSRGNVMNGRVSNEINVVEERRGLRLPFLDMFGSLRRRLAYIFYILGLIKDTAAQEL